jgi:hypothetical protein
MCMSAFTQGHEDMVNPFYTRIRSSMAGLAYIW